MRSVNTKRFLIIFLVNYAIAVNAQDSKKLYDPSLDGMKQISEAVAAAKENGKHVLLQFGGNWCSWCIKFDTFCKQDTTISKLINDNYLPVKLNYDQTNRNEASNKFLGNPVRFGFPVFIVLDGSGKVIHIQDSGLLEEGTGYDRKKVIGFFRSWTPSALIPPEPAKKAK